MESIFESVVVNDTDAYKERFFGMPRALNFGLESLVNAKSPVQYIPGLAPGRVGLLVAPGSTGKSFLMLQLAVAAASNCFSKFFPGWPGFEASQTIRHKVLYIPAEEDEKSLLIRLRAVVNGGLGELICKYESSVKEYEQLENDYLNHKKWIPCEKAAASKTGEKQQDGVFSRLRRYYYDTETKLYDIGQTIKTYRDIIDEVRVRLDIVPLARFPEDKRPTLPEQAHILDRMIAQGGYTIVMIDPLAQFLGSGVEENSNTDMTHVVQSLTKVAQDRKVAILVSHHATKSSVQQNKSDQQQAARGATALVDAARLVMNLKKVDDGEIILTYSKYNEAKNPGEIFFAREKSGYLRNIDLNGPTGKNKKTQLKADNEHLPGDVVAAISAGSRARRKRSSRCERKVA